MEIFTETQLQIIAEMKSQISKLNGLFKKASEEKLETAVQNNYDDKYVVSVSVHIGCRLTLSISGGA